MHKILCLIVKVLFIFMSGVEWNWFVLEASVAYRL